MEKAADSGAGADGGLEQAVPAAEHILQDVLQVGQGLLLVRLVGEQVHKGVDLHVGQPVDGVVLRRGHAQQRGLPVGQLAVVLLRDGHQLVHKVFQAGAVAAGEQQQKQVVVLDA